MSSHLLSFGLPFPWGVVRAHQGAYDVQMIRSVYMKAFWRIRSSNNDTKEGEVYQVLNEKNVPNIPRCSTFRDLKDQYRQTQTDTVAKKYLASQGYKYSAFSRRLHILVLDTEGKKLEDFTGSRELVRAIRAAIIGMDLPGCDFLCQTLMLTCVL